MLEMKMPQNILQIQLKKKIFKKRTYKGSATSILWFVETAVPSSGA